MIPHEVNIMKHNWEKIKTEYITTDISTRKLAEKHHTTQGEISKRCSKEKWVELRKDHRYKVTSKAVQKTASLRANLLEKELQSLGYLSESISAAASDPHQFQRHIINCLNSDGSKVPKEMICAKYDTKSLRELASTIAIVVGLKMQIAGILTERDSIMADIAQQRLEIERMKYELMIVKSSCADSHEVRVIIADELQPFAI